MSSHAPSYARRRPVIASAAMAKRTLASVAKTVVAWVLLIGSATMHFGKALLAGVDQGSNLYAIAQHLEGARRLGTGTVNLGSVLLFLFGATGATIITLFIWKRGPFKGIPASHPTLQAPTNALTAPAVSADPPSDSKWTPELCARIHPSFPIREGALFGLDPNGVITMKVLIEWLAPFPAEDFQLRGKLTAYFPDGAAAYKIDEHLSLPKMDSPISTGATFKKDLELRSYDQVKVPPGCIHQNMLHMTCADLEISCSMLGPWKPDARGIHTRKTRLWIPIVQRGPGGALPITPPAAGPNLGNTPHDAWLDEKIPCPGRCNGTHFRRRDFLKLPDWADFARVAGKPLEHVCPSCFRFFADGAEIKDAKKAFS